MNIVVVNSSRTIRPIIVIIAKRNQSFHSGKDWGRGTGTGSAVAYTQNRV